MHVQFKLTSWACLRWDDGILICCCSSSPNRQLLSAPLTQVYNWQEQYVLTEFWHLIFFACPPLVSHYFWNPGAATGLDEFLPRGQVRDICASRLPRISKSVLDSEDTSSFYTGCCSSIFIWTVLQIVSEWLNFKMSNKRDWVTSVTLFAHGISDSSTCLCSSVCMTHAYDGQHL